MENQRGKRELFFSFIVYYLCVIFVKGRKDENEKGK